MMIKTLLKLLPFNVIVVYLLDHLEDLAKKTESKWDDDAVALLKVFFSEANVDASGVKLDPPLKNLLKAISLQRIIAFILDEIGAMVKKSETKFDDAVFAYIVSWFTTLGLYKPNAS